MASNLLDRLSKPSGTLEAIMLAIITHSAPKDEASIGYPGFRHHRCPSAENK